MSQKGLQGPIELETSGPGASHLHPDGAKPESQPTTGEIPNRAIFKGGSSAAQYTQAKATLNAGPTGAFFSIRRADDGDQKPVITSAELDRALDAMLSKIPADAPVVIAGVAVKELSKSRHARRVSVVEADRLPDTLLDYLGQKVFVLARSSFAEAFREQIDRSLIVNLQELDLRSPGVFAPHPLREKLVAGDPIFIETYAEFPKLLEVYLAEMESLRSALAISGKLPLLAEVEKILDGFEERRERIPGLPPMTLDDVKMNLAALITRAKKERGLIDGAEEIAQRVHDMRGLLSRAHEFSLPLDHLPDSLRKRVDKNNLVLATLETEARLALIDDVRAVIEPHADGVNVLGSAAWGAYYQVKKTSDIDLEVVIADRDLDSFKKALDGVELRNLDGPRALQLLQRGEGKLFELLRGLVDRGYAKGDTPEERARSALLQLGTFVRLRELDAPKSAGAEDARPGHRDEARVTERMSDYLAYKVDVGIDLSIHFFSAESWTRAAALDLEKETHTRTMGELRVGERKKVSPRKQERTLEDSTIYPQKKSFDGRSLDYECDVRAVVERGGKVELIKPSELAARGLGEGDVLAWLTDTPAVVYEEGRLYHGLFQDKVLWGELSERTDPALHAAKDRLASSLMRRFTAEVAGGTIDDPRASITQLTSRGERIPPFTRRSFLESLRDRCPEEFAIMRAAMEALGSTELARLKIAERSRDPQDIELDRAERAELTRRAQLGSAQVAGLVEALGQTQDPALFGRPNAEIVFMIKPLGMEQGVAEKVKKFIRDHGGRISGEWHGIADTRRIAEHYAQHATKPVFGDMVAYFAGQEVSVFRVRIAEDKIDAVRKLLGSYKPAAGSLRDELVGDRWIDLYQRTGIVDNGLHISDSRGEGAREAKIWFEVPPIVTSRAETKRAHEYLYRALSRIDPGVQFAGSQYSGLAIDAKADDLDYRLLAADVDQMAKEVARLPGVTFRREGIDHKSGQRFLLFEHKWKGGKADIAVVPADSFRSRVSASVLAKFLPEEWKAQVREIKEKWRVPMERAIAEHGHGSPEYKATKAEYEREKKELYRTVKRYFGISQKSGELPALEARPIPAQQLASRLAQLESHDPGLGGQLQRVVEMVPASIRGALLEHVLAFDVPPPPAELAPAIARAREEAAAESAALVEKHRAAFQEYRAPHVPLKAALDELVQRAAEESGGAAVLTPIKGEKRGVARAVLKGSAEEPNWFEIKDMVRASIVVPSVADAGAAIDRLAELLGGRIKIELDKSGQIVKVPKNRFHRPVGGYYDYMLKADFGGGRQGEIQFHIPEMMVAKFVGKGHETYDLIRDVARLFDHPVHGEAARKYWSRLDVAMRDYYGVVMELARRATEGEGPADHAPKVGVEGTFLELSTPYVDSLIEAHRKERKQGP